MNCTIIIPTMNELDGLKNTLPQIKKEWYEQIVILDGDSSDGTKEWLEKEFPKLVFYRQHGKGLWNAYREVFLSGVITGDIVITLSPDGNCPITDIPKLKESIENDNDMVIASRYLAGNKSEDDTKITAFGNHLLTGICNVLSNGDYSDALNMYRAYRTCVIKQLGFLDRPNWLQRLMAMQTSLFSFEPSLSIRAKKHGLKVSEIMAFEPKAYRERRQNTFVHGATILTQILYEGWIRE